MLTQMIMLPGDHNELHTQFKQITPLLSYDSLLSLDIGIIYLLWATDDNLEVSEHVNINVLQLHIYWAAYNRLQMDS